MSSSTPIEQKLATALMEYNMLGDPEFWRPMARFLVKSLLDGGVVFLDDRTTHYELIGLPAYKNQMTVRP